MKTRQRDLLKKLADAFHGRPGYSTRTIRPARDEARTATELVVLGLASRTRDGRIEATLEGLRTLKALNEAARKGHF